MTRVLFALIALAGAYYAGLYWSFTPDDPGWRAAADSPIKRFEGPGVTVGGRLYLFFGYEDYVAKDHLLVATNDVSSYDPVADEWRRHRPAPFTGTHVNGVHDGRFVWFAGGFEGNHPGPAVTTVWKYDPREDAWSRGPDLPAARGGGALALAGTELHYISGYYAALEEPSSDNHWVLDLEDEAAGWRDEPPLPVSRGHAGSITLGDHIYIVGGSLTHHPTWIDTDLVHRYDTRTNAWERRADLPYVASHFEPGIYSSGGNIVVAGGRSGQASRLKELEIQDVLVYQPADDRWQRVGSLPLPLRAPVVARVADHLVVTTGSTHWAQEPTAKTYVLPCSGRADAFCAARGGSLKLRLKSLNQGLALRMPWKLQTLMGLQAVAGID